MQHSIQCFSDSDIEDITEILGRYGCRKMPTGENIKQLMCEIAHKELIQTPMFVLDSWKEVLVTDGESLLDIQNVEALYKESIPNPRSVLRKLEFPEVLKQEEANTKIFLEQYIRDTDVRKQKLLLRFCTGYNILNKHNKIIKVMFSPMSDFCRRPIGHTCGQTLELGQEYPNYPTFRSELNMVLESGVLTFDIV